MERKVTLKFGYQDKNEKGINHTEVVFGRRPNGKDWIAANDSGDGSQTRYQTALIAAALSKFGDLPTPVPQSVLLELNRVDREKLFAEFMLFLSESSEGREAKQLAPGRVHLAFGLTRADSIHYEIVEFGHLLTGYDEVKIEAQAENETQALALKLAKAIGKFQNIEGNRSSTAAVELSDIEKLDFADLTFLRKAEVEWINSFR
jgi:hypothetical protein